MKSHQSSFHPTFQLLHFFINHQENQNSSFQTIIKMSSPPNPNNPNSLNPQVIQTTPDQNTNPPSSSSLYPTVEIKETSENLIPDPRPSALPVEVSSSEHTILKISGAILHLIDKMCSVELACGDFSIIRLCQDKNAVVIMARIDDIQWPLTKDEAAVKLDDTHYFFALRMPKGDGSDSDSDSDSDSGDELEDQLNYGLTFASKGQEELLQDLDGILETCSGFSVHKVSEKSEVLDGSVANQVTCMEDASAVYWTTLAPNVEEYSGCVAKAIALGSGQLIKGILWCGDVTVDGLKWGNEMLKKRLEPNDNPSEISKDAMKRIQRIKRITSMSETVASGILTGAVKVSGFVTSSVANSRMGKKLIDLLPGEVVVASLDGFGKICDAVEVSGKNVLSTSSVVTTELVSHRYGEQAAELTTTSLGAAGHALGTAWAVFQIRKAFQPQSAIKPTKVVKAAVADMKAKADKKVKAEMKAKDTK